MAYDHPQRDHEVTAEQHLTKHREQPFSYDSRLKSSTADVPTEGIPISSDAATQWTPHRLRLTVCVDTRCP